MKNKNFDKKQLFILIASPVLSLISFVLAYFLDPLNYQEHVSLAAIPAFLLSIIILVIGQIITIHNEVEKVSVDSERIYETVKNYLHVTKMGTPQSAWRYIIERLPILEYVQNTSFNFEDEKEESNERLYDNNVYQQSLKVIAMYVNKGLKWNDIGDFSAIERFRQIASSISNNSRWSLRISTDALLECFSERTDTNTIDRSKKLTCGTCRKSPLFFSVFTSLHAKVLLQRL